MKTKMGVKVQCLGLFVYLMVMCICDTRATNIDCVPLKECPMAVALMRRNAPEAQQFFRESRCGPLDFFEPMIFCPRFQRCSTAIVKNGVCAHPHNCRKFLDLAGDFGVADNEMDVFMHKHRCYNDDDEDFRICCPEDFATDAITRRAISTTSTTTSTTTTSTTTVSPSTPENRIYFDGPISSESNLPDPNLGECGIQITQGNKITGGTSTELEEYPWMVLLAYQSKNGIQNGCGGSLINSKYIVTAGHCLHPEIYQKNNLIKLKYVVLGEYNTKTEKDCIYDVCSDPILNIPIRRTIIHPKFSLPLAPNDIGLIEMERSVQFTDFIRPICLPNKSFTLKGNETFEVAGWGQTSTKRISDVKQKTRLRYAPADKCRNINNKIGITKGQICAGKGDGKDTCRGDSGGPLMLGKIIGTDFVYSLIGVTSFGFIKCGSGPSVYTFVPNYYDWIVSNLE